MTKIFLSYRREDSAALTGRIYDRLQSHFGRDSVYIDIDTIPPGVDFRIHINDAVSQCNVFLAIIGNQWISAYKNEHHGLDDPNDFVRIEIEAALSRNIHVIPILIGKATMPSRDELPDSLVQLAYRNAVQIDIGRDFHSHMDRLIHFLEQLFKTPLPSLTTTVKDNMEKLYVISTGMGEHLNLYSAPGFPSELDSSLICTLIAGDNGEIIESAKGKNNYIWYNIRTESGEEGWITEASTGSRLQVSMTDPRLCFNLSIKGKNLNGYIKKIKSVNGSPQDYSIVESSGYIVFQDAILGETKLECKNIKSIILSKETSKIELVDGSDFYPTGTFGIEKSTSKSFDSFLSREIIFNNEICLWFISKNLRLNISKLQDATFSRVISVN